MTDGGCRIGCDCDALLRAVRFGWSLMMRRCRLAKAFSRPRRVVTRVQNVQQSSVNYGNRI